MSAPLPGVLVEDVGAVREIRISNPEKRNALTRRLLDELVAALPEANAAVRAVVLRGDPAGAAFSSGYDITAIDEAERAQGLDPIDGPARALERCPVPVLAALDGPAFGGGLELAVACDIRVAAPGVKLGMPPARLGLVYAASGLQRFMRAISPSQAKRLFLSAEPISSEEACRIGLVDVLATTSSAYELARALAERIAENAPLAVQGMLDALRRLSRPGGPSEEDLEAIAAARARTVASEDLAEGVRAFAEKRAPVFRGR